MAHAHPDGPPARITAHIISAHMPTARADSLPAGGPKRHAMHAQMHDGNIATPAEKTSMSALMRSAAKGK